MLSTAKVLDVSLRATKCHFNCYGRLSWERSGEEKMCLQQWRGQDGMGEGGCGGLEPASNQVKSIILKSQPKEAVA